MCAVRITQPRSVSSLRAALIIPALCARRALLDNFSDGSMSMGCLSSRGNVDGNPDLREVDEAFPAPPGKCTMRQLRQRVPLPAQPPNGYQLIHHTLSGCWVDPAQARVSTPVLGHEISICGKFIIAAAVREPSAHQARFTPRAMCPLQTLRAR